MSEQSVAEYRIEGLAHHSGATVRTIRAYQDRGLLPKPERRGRSNVYGPGHLARLRQIAGLLDRGYTLASIRELLEAWDTGRGLAGVLEPGVPEPEHVRARPPENRVPEDAEQPAAAGPARRPRPLIGRAADIEPAGAIGVFADLNAHRIPAVETPSQKRGRTLSVSLPAETIRAVEGLVGPGGTAAFIAAAAEREVRARVLDGLAARALRDSPLDQEN
ncbi:MerR family transcriptional regulator [Streptomyces sp. CAU 1734]|uniref:MerR family transcriptional regulator n=1 Tax=Streptomyces sp. CAU 1734 TaxID=3140360 RepID=UPI003260BA76